MNSTGNGAGGNPEINPAPEGGKPSLKKEETAESEANVEGSAENDSDAIGNTQEVISPDEPLFSGEAKLVISQPVRMDTLLKLYNYLQTLPDIKLVYTSGAKDTEVAIMISVDKPTSISKLLSGMGVTLATEGAVGQAPGEEMRPIFERKRNPVKEIRLVAKE